MIGTCSADMILREYHYPHRSWCNSLSTATRADVAVLDDDDDDGVRVV
jgi:hypothetical protein